jgi:hypothetical protein
MTATLLGNLYKLYMYLMTYFKMERNFLNFYHICEENTYSRYSYIINNTYHYSVGLLRRSAKGPERVRL